MKPLAILIGANVPPDPNAGASGTVWQMAEALKRRGHYVETFWAHDLGRRIQHGNLHYLYELPYTYRREVRRRVATRAFDVLELNQPHACAAARDHRVSGRSGVFINRSHGHEVRSEEALAPWRRTLGLDSREGIRKWISNCIRRRLDAQWEQISRDSDGFVVSCREDRDFLVERYSVAPERIGLITQGVPDEYLNRPLQPLTPERLQRHIYVGQVAFFKAPHMLARAVSNILNKSQSATFTWICSKDHHSAALELVEESVRHRVQMLNWMTQDQLISILDQHGIFLFPSYFEGFGKAPLEAMARGLCVIASACGGMRDYICDQENGILTPIGQPEVMAARALELMQEHERAANISSAARRTTQQHTWDRCAADAEAFYYSLISRQTDAGNPLTGTRTR